MKIRSNTLESLLLGSLILVTIAITPFFSYDPFNIPKFAVLFIFSAVILILLFINRKILLSKNYKFILLLTSLFGFWSFISSIVSKTDKIETFYGITGRQTGFLTYLSLLVIFMGAISVGSYSTSIKTLGILIISGLISSVYGLIQYFNLDKYDWINPYSPVIGFLGNPNFQSSLLGISATAAFALISRNQLVKSSFFLIFILFSVYSISLTQSRQGYLVLVIGIASSLYFRIKFSNSLGVFARPYLVLLLFGVIAAISDMLQKSPWPGIIYKPSVTYRGDFWRAGWNMTLDNPIFGVGLDGFRDNYRINKDQASALRPIPDAVVDSAHNIFIDISSSGGFPLLIIYILIIAYTLSSVYKIFKRSNSQNLVLSGIFSCWVAYTAQSVISISNIGLAVWGWALSGLIIGYEINTRQGDSKPLPLKLRSPRVAIISGFTIGTLIVAPQVLVDARFNSAVESKDYSKIYANALQWPQSIKRITLMSEELRINGFLVQSRELALEAIKLNPQSFEAWLVFARLPNSSEIEVNTALNKLRELDPLNPGLK